MGHGAVVHPFHPDRGIEGDGLLSAVGDGEVFQCHIGASDRDDRSVSVPFDAGSPGHSNESEGLVDAEVATQGTGRETDHRTGRGAVDGFLEGGAYCGGKLERQYDNQCKIIHSINHINNLVKERTAGGFVDSSEMRLTDCYGLEYNWGKEAAGVGSALLL